MFDNLAVLYLGRSRPVRFSLILIVLIVDMSVWFSGAFVSVPPQAWLELRSVGELGLFVILKNAETCVIVWILHGV